MEEIPHPLDDFRSHPNSQTAYVVRLKLLCINSKAVIPAKAGIQIENTGFRVKPGMTNKGKELLTHYTNDHGTHNPIYSRTLRLSFYFF